MDPISKALERARQEQQTVRSWVQPNAGSRERESMAPRVVARGNRRSVTLQPEWLDGHVILAGNGTENPVIADKYRLLRTRIGQIMRARGWQTIGITSPGVKAGKSVTSINLAISMAREGNHDVMLVDGDIRKPSVQSYLGLQGSLGLPDYLRGEANLDDCAVDITEPKGLSVLPGSADTLVGQSPEILKSERLEDLLRGLPAADRDLVIVVDLPPVLIGDDVIAVASHLDCLLLVVDAMSTDADDLKHSADLLKDFNLIGTVLNNADEKPKAHEGYYSAYYRAPTEGATNGSAQDS